MNRLILLLCLGCFTTQIIGSENTLYEEVIYNKPDIKSVTEVYLGDRMLSQQVGEWRECITPRKTYSKTARTWTVTYKARSPICKPKLSSKQYIPTYVNARGIEDRIHAVTWKGKKGKYKLCQNGLVKALCIENLSENDVQVGEAFIYTPNSFQQTIEYSGKSDQILKFNYAEFTNGFAREAFSREFQVDLSEGNIAAYKGAIIEIIEATNVQIKYKVIRNFSSDS